MPILPVEYIAYVRSGRRTNGFTDFGLGGYFDLEPLESIPKLNLDIELQRYAPGFIAFASDGGGEVLAFDAVGKVYSIPLIGMSPESATLVANSWNEYSNHIQPDV